MICIGRKCKNYAVSTFRQNIAVNMRNKQLRLFAVYQKTRRQPLKEWQDKYDWNVPFSNPMVNEIENYHEKQRQQLRNKLLSEDISFTTRANEPRKLNLKNASKTTSCVVRLQGLSQTSQETHVRQEVNKILGHLQQSIVSTFWLLDNEGYTTDEVLLEMKSDEDARKATELNVEDLSGHDLREDVTKLLNTKRNDMRLYEGYSQHRKNGREREWWWNQNERKLRLSHRSLDKQMFLRALKSQQFAEQNINTSIHSENFLSLQSDGEASAALKKRNKIQKDIQKKREDIFQKIKRLQQQQQQKDIENHEQKTDHKLNSLLDEYLSLNSEHHSSVSELCHNYGIQISRSQIDYQNEIDSFRERLRKKGIDEDDTNKLVRVFSVKWKNYMNGRNEISRIPEVDVEDFLAKREEYPETYSSKFQAVDRTFDTDAFLEREEQQLLNSKQYRRSDLYQRPRDYMMMLEKSYRGEGEATHSKLIISLLDENESEIWKFYEIE